MPDYLSAVFLVHPCGQSPHIAILREEENGKQRPVRDCRRTNQFFRNPHRPELGPAEAIQGIEHTTGPPVYEAKADLKNCFHQMGIEAWLPLFFCFEDRASGSFIRKLGCQADIDGSGSAPYWF